MYKLRARSRSKRQLIVFIALSTASAIYAQPRKVGPGPPPVILNPVVTSVQPLFGNIESGGSVKIEADGPITGATSAVFGSASANLDSTEFSSDALSVVLSSPPSQIAGSTVPVSVIWKGSVIPSNATFSYPLGLMQVEGPGWHLDDDLECTERFWTNGTGYIFQVGQPGTLSFGTLSPIIHISTGFIDISSSVGSQPAGPSAPSQLLGNEAVFAAFLETCNISAAPNANGSCKNWDNNSGYWVQADTRVTQTLASAGSGQTTSGDLALPIPGGTFSLAGTASNIAGTFRINLFLQEQDTRSASANCRQATQWSDPFNVIVGPTAMIQLNTVPYTIVYQPPGNQSIASFTANTLYGTQFSLGSSNEIDNTTSTEQSSSTNFSIKEVMSGLGADLNQSDTWDQTTTETFGTTHDSSNNDSSSMAFTLTETIPADPSLVPGSGVTCATQSSCSSTVQTPNAYELEPFWDDTFYLMVHPQFAVWVIGGQQDRYVMYGALQTLIDVLVGQLDACAQGSSWYGLDPCHLTYSSSELTGANGKPLSYQGKSPTLTLTASEAATLLALDPFYAGGQNANVDATRTTPMGGYNYGAAIGIAPRSQTINLANTQASQNSSGGQTTSSLSSTTVWGSNTAVGVSLSLSGNTGSAAPLTEDLTFANGFKDTQGTTVKTSFQNSTAVSNQTVTTANGTLNDVDSSDPACKPPCHLPFPNQPSVNVYFDKVFGSFMFQDPNAPSNPGRSTYPKCCSIFINSLVREEAKHPRFSDVPSSDPWVGPIGVLALINVIPGVTATTFEPDGEFTREQLATALAAGLNLPSAGTETGFSDVNPSSPTAAAIASTTKDQLIVTPSATTFGPTDALTRQDFAVSLVRAFNLATQIATVTDSSEIALYAKDAVPTVVAKGYMRTLDGAFQPTGTLTREQAAQSLFAAIRDYSALGSPKKGVMVITQRPTIP